MTSRRPQPLGPAPARHQHQHGTSTAPALRSLRQPAAPAALSKAAAGYLSTPLAKPFVGLVGTPVFLAAEVVVLLGMLALTDAAYSGDWSRIGAISADTEPVLQKLTIIAWSGHALCAALAAAIVRGGAAARSTGSAAFKAFLFGALHVFEEAVVEQQQLEATAAPANGRQRRR